MNKLNFEFSYPFYLSPNSHATWCTQVLIWQELEKYDSEFSFTAVVTGFHVYRRVWLPHLGQRLSMEREHGNAGDHIAITVREHSDTRADEDVNNRPIVGHLS